MELILACLCFQDPAHQLHLDQRCNFATKSGIYEQIQMPTFLYMMHLNLHQHREAYQSGQAGEVQNQEGQAYL